jgi:hypothetical protein
MVATGVENMSQGILLPCASQLVGEKTTRDNPSAGLFAVCWLALFGLAISLTVGIDPSVIDAMCF